MTEWSEVHVGDVLTVRKPWHRRGGYRLRVASVEPISANPDSRYRWVVGERLRLSGKPSTRRSKPELVSIDDVNQRRYGS